MHPDDEHLTEAEQERRQQYARPAEKPKRPAVEWHVPRPTKESRCRSCGARVVWVETATGKKMPLDLSHARTLEDGESAAPSHFAFCKDADRWRNKK
jgi:hypothetical protein